MASSLQVKKTSSNKIAVGWVVRENQSPITSTPFSIISDGRLISFNLTMIPQGKNLDICIISSCRCRVIVKLIVYLPEGKRTLMALIEDFYCEEKLTSLENSFGKDLFLRIDCDITWLGGTHHNDKICRDPGLLSISDVAFDNSRDPDFHIIVDGRRLAAHKLILSTHSEVLAAMFKTPMKESNENEMTIKDIEYSTMETLLKIIYTGVTDDLDNIEMALKILEVSEIYQMEAIKSLCQVKLQLNIADDNVVRLLKAADKNRASNLCNTCLEYITAKDGKILSNDELRELADGSPFIKSAISDLWFSLADCLVIEQL